MCSNRRPGCAAASTAAGPSSCAAARSVSPGNPGVDRAAGPFDQYLTVDALMKAYGTDPLYAAGDFGQGVTIDVFEGEANFPSDIATYEACFGLHTPVSYVGVAGGPQAPKVSKHDGLETELDIETLATIAPDAAINVYQSTENNVDTLDEYATMVDSDNAQVISTSWGECEDASLILGPRGAGFLTAERLLFEQAAAQGQSVVAAAGDSGSEDCNIPLLPTSPIDPVDPIAAQEVDDPASDPFVTGVGGTSLSLDASGQRSQEVVWNAGPAYGDKAHGAGGGGASHYWSMPSWQFSTLSQRGWLPSFLAPHAPCLITLDPHEDAYCREVPDVTADAAPDTGLVIFWASSWTHVGGTSAGAPLWAGLAALADSCARGWGSKPVGFLNPALYAMASDPGRDAHAFTDITSGNNDYVFPFLHPEGYAAGNGYDMASGLGAPVAGTGNQGVVDQLCAGAPRG